MFPLAILITAIWASACTYLYRCLRRLQAKHDERMKSSSRVLQSIQSEYADLWQRQQRLLKELSVARAEIDAHRLIDRAIEGTPIPLDLADLEMVTEKTIVIAPKKARKPRAKVAKPVRKARVAR